MDLVELVPTTMFDDPQSGSISGLDLEEEEERAPRGTRPRRTRRGSARSEKVGSGRGGRPTQEGRHDRLGGSCAARDAAAADGRGRTHEELEQGLATESAVAQRISFIGADDCVWVV